MKKIRKKTNSTEKIPRYFYLTHKPTDALSTVIIMILFLERLSMWNMLNCAEQLQIPK